MLAVIRGGVDFYGPNVGVSSFVDPNLDPVGSETFIGIRIQTNYSGSGQLRIQNELEVKLRYSGKLIKFDKFLNKMI